MPQFVLGRPVPSQPNPIPAAFSISILRSSFSVSLSQIGMKVAIVSRTGLATRKEIPDLCPAIHKTRVTYLTRKGENCCSHYKYLDYKIFVSKFPTSGLNLRQMYGNMPLKSEILTLEEDVPKFAEGIEKLLFVEYFIQRGARYLFPVSARRHYSAEDEIESKICFSNKRNVEPASKDGESYFSFSL